MQKSALTRLRAAVVSRLATEAGRQTAVLYAAQLSSMALNFLFTVVIGRTMSQEDFGVFSFCAFSIIIFSGYMFEFGVFSAGARLLAIAGTPEAERRTFGTLVVAGLAIGLLFAIVIAASGPGIDAAMHALGFPDTQVARILLIASPLAASVPLQLLIEFTCQGTNRIGMLAAFRLALPIASISTILGLRAVYGDISPLSALVAYLAGITVAVVGVGAALRPSFAIGRRDFKQLAAAVREYGLDMYLGRAINMMSARLDQVLIPLFVGPKRWGAYRIAQQVSDPVQNLARSLATTRFKSFASRTHVSVYIERWNMALLAVAAFLLASLGPWAITFVFPGKFRNALPLLLPFALVAFFAGLLQPYNTFLTAHGAGRALRNIALALGVLNLGGLLFVVRRYGLLGAAWFAVGSMAFNFCLHLYYYQRLRSDLERTNTQHEHHGDGDQTTDPRTVGQ
ncbi:MAG TPA: lipopolysaccharide biosynthesis protein [Blastocatellia bacterium]|nr:lipopolysaccharide biosynthesis protein [Blastocatellia bacterium]